MNHVLSESIHQLIVEHWLLFFVFLLATTAIVLGLIIALITLKHESDQRRRSDRRLASISQQLPGAVYEARVDPAGVVSLDYAAGDTESIFGFPIATLLTDPESVFASFDQDDRATLVCAFQQQSTTLTQTGITFRFYNYLGTRYLHTRATPGPTIDGTTWWSGYWIDTTHQHEQASALARARDEATRATRARDVFLATVSHELRTPLSGMIGLMELLADSRLEPSQRSLVEDLQTAAEHQLQMFDNVLDFSRLEVDRIELDPTPTDLRLLLESTVLLLAPRIHARGLKLGVYIAKDVKRLLEVDATRLRQILFNLLNNAFKFTHVGRIDISLRTRETTPTRQTLSLCVRDSGIGIAPERQAAIFEPFTQASADTAGHYGGAGLGLAICRRLAEAMNGSLTLESTFGSGTTITLELPLAIPLDVAEPTPPLTGTACLALTNTHAIDAEIADTLAACLAGLGVRCDSPPAIPADWRFVDEADLGMAKDEGDSRLIGVTQRALLSGFEVDTTGQVIVSVNPLRESALLNACRYRKEITPAREADTPISTDRAPRRVLVAEDNPLIGEVAKAQLESLGLIVVWVEDGDAALARLEAEAFDLLLTDCHMPRRDGYALCQALRERERHQEIQSPIIVGMTANAHTGEAERCLAAGMDDFLPKPLRRASLERLLERWLPAAPEPEPKLEREPQSAPSHPPFFTAPSSERLNLSILAKIYGDAALPELVERLAATTREDIAALRTLYRQGDHDGLTARLHRMNGGLELLGPSEGVINDAATHAADMETLLRRGGTPDEETFAWLMQRLDALATALETVPPDQ